MIDASQGVEAQTLANAQLADAQGLTIIPVINKVDLPSADVDRVSNQIERNSRHSRRRSVFMRAENLVLE